MPSPTSVEANRYGGTNHSLGWPQPLGGSQERGEWLWASGGRAVPSPSAAFPRLAGDATPQGRTPPGPPTHPACSMALGCPSAFWARHSLHTHSLIGAFRWL